MPVETVMSAAVSLFCSAIASRIPARIAADGKLPTVDTTTYRSMFKQKITDKQILPLLRSASQLFHRGTRCFYPAARRAG